MKKKYLSVALLIALALMFVPIPFISGSSIAQVIIFVVAIILLITEK